MSLRRALGAAALVGLLLIGVGAAALYSARGSLSALAAMAYLRSQGVPADIRFERLDAQGFSGALVLGPAGRPDLTAAHVEGRFAKASGVFAWPRVVSVTLLAPRLHATFDGRRLSFGSLQGLIDRLGHGTGGGPGPDVVVTSGLMVLTTPGGDLTAHFDGRLHAGQLVEATARLPPSHLQAGPVAIFGLTGLVTIRSSFPERLTLDLRLGSDSLRTAAAEGEAVDLAAHVETAAAAAPEVTGGPLHGTATLRARRLGGGGGTLIQPQATLTLDGRLQTDPGGVGLTGDAVLNGSAGGGSFRTATSGPLTLRATSSDLSLKWRKAALTGAAPFKAAFAATDGRTDPGALQAGRLTIKRIAIAAGGRVSVSALGAEAQASGSAVAEGGLAQTFGPVAINPDFRTLADGVQRDLSHVTIEVPQYAMTVSRAGYRLEVSRTVSARTVSGAVVTLEPYDQRPLAAAAAGAVAGAFRGRLSGPGLPSVSLTVSGYQLGTDARGPTVKAAGEIAADGDVGSYVGAHVSAAATVSERQGLLSVSAPHCGELGLDAYRTNGGVALRSLKLQLCPGSEPVATLAKDHWAATVKISGGSLDLSASSVGVQSVQGQIRLNGRMGDAPTGALELGGALSDLQSPTRFSPLIVSARFGLASNRLKGDFDIGLPDPRQILARGDADYDIAGKAAHATVRSENLVLAANGLQPAALAPSLSRWASNAHGAVSASADLAWSNDRLSSKASLRLSGVDFKSPAGQLTGLNGSLAFSSLAPLTADPGQTLTAERLSSFIPLTHLTLSFGLTPAALSLGSAAAEMAGGGVALKPMQVPLGPGSTVVGALTFRHVDLQPLIDSTSLSNAVSVQTHVSGVLPFSSGPAGLRFGSGELAADGPGRLTIHRQALTGAVATAGSGGAQPNAVQDFAYQALEDLAFDSLSAKIASRPEGRLGLLLQVKGRHDPATAAPTRVNLINLALGHAFDKPVPLPKGTPVNLTLDGSLNFDELLAAYGALNAGTGSAKVQPKP